MIRITKRVGFLMLGFFAFLWVVFRSGTNPKRLVYPCQQAAFPLASSWLIAILALLGGALIAKKILRLSVRSIVFLLPCCLLTSSMRCMEKKNVGNYPVWKSDDTKSKIFLNDKLSLTSGSLAAGDENVPDAYLSDPGIDTLLKIMHSNGQSFYKTVSHPNGVVGRDDVVIIKANFQWRGRLSTNTDRIKGVVNAILSHPEGFDGEIIVTDNGSEQIQPEVYFCGFSDFANNSDDPEQSILDVVSVFKAKGFPVDYHVWDNLNNSIVGEYTEGDFEDGYVYNSTTKVNYPKFQSKGGNLISLKYGIWNASTENYILDKLSIINMPVLKAHGLGGATIAVKNWIGVMNQMHVEAWYGGYDEFHNNFIFSEYSLPARVLDEIWPKLSIVDATYTATRSNFEPGSPVIKTNTVLASTDPVAVSWYAAKFILNPIAQYNRVDPDFKNGGKDHYGTVLGCWYEYFKRHTSRSVTMDQSKISVYGTDDIVNSNQQLKMAESVIVYPNPSKNGLFNIEFLNGFMPEKTVLIEGNGKKIAEFLPDDNNLTIDISSYPSGTYYLRVFYGVKNESVALIKL